MKKLLATSMMAIFMFAIASINIYAQPTITFMANNGKVGLPEVMMGLGGNAMNLDFEFHAVISDMRPCTVIDTAAFAGRKNLLSIQLPAGLTTISYFAFAGCENLVLTSLPASVTLIEESAFYGCKKLALTSLPAGITVIQSGTFAGCESLENLTLPSGLTSIGDSAFFRCTGLKQITCLRPTPPTLGKDVFVEVPQSACTLIVANCAAVASYKNAAQWKEFFIVPNELSNTLSLKTNPANAGTVTGSGTFPLYQFAKFSATANAGFEFVNWTDSATSAIISESQADSIKMNGCPVVLIANFEELDVEIFVVELISIPEDAGELEGFGEYEEGETATISAIANEGFEFVNWTNIAGDIISVENSFEIIVVSDTILIANFEEVPVEYTITLLANPTDGGNVSGDGVFEKNEIATILATANECYEFINWTNSNGDEISTANPYEFPVVSNLTLTANFELKQVLAEVVAGENGKITDVTDDDELFDALSFNTSCGNEIGIFAVADDGYKFSNWTSNGVVISSANPLTVVLLRDTNLVANFVAEGVELFEVEVTIAPEDAGTVMGAGNFEINTSVTLTALPNDDYEFLNWISNGVIIYEDNPFTFILTQDTAIVANFKFVSITENTLISSIKILPNPVHQDAIIEINSLESQPNTVITILDLSGREILTVYSGLLSEGTNHFPLPNNLPSGNYFVLVENSNGRKSEQFIVGR